MTCSCDQLVGIWVAGSNCAAAHIHDLAIASWIMPLNCEFANGFLFNNRHYVCGSECINWDASRGVSNYQLTCLSLGQFVQCFYYILAVVQGSHSVHYGP